MNSKIVTHVDITEHGLQLEIMDHPYIQSSEPDKCLKCRRKEIDHTDLAICEACPNVGTCTVYFGILLCESCLQKEKDNQTPEAQNNRLKNHRVETEIRAKEIDLSVTSKAEWFNAETVAIGELRDVIEADTTIENKRLALFQALDLRYKHFKNILVQIETEREKTMTQVRASYEYMATLSNQLTEEERKKYQIADFNYKPNQVVTKPKAAPTQKNKFSKAELIDASNKHQIPMAALQTLCVRFNCGIQEAVSRFQEAMKGL